MEQSEVLNKILENQELQISMQRESLEIQKKLFELSESNFARVDKINDRAEKIQDKASALQDKSKWILLALIPIGLIAISLIVWGLRHGI